MKKAVGSPAKVTIKVQYKGAPVVARPIHKALAEMTTDLPAERLGEEIAAAINAVWKTGIEPTDFRVELYFS